MTRGCEGLEVRDSELGGCWHRVRGSLACNGMERLASLHYFTGSASGFNPGGQRGKQWLWMLPPIPELTRLSHSLRDRRSEVSPLFLNQWLEISIALSFGFIYLIFYFWKILKNIENHTHESNHHLCSYQQELIILIILIYWFPKFSVYPWY